MDLPDFVVGIKPRYRLKKKSSDEMSEWATASHRAPDAGSDTKDVSTTSGAPMSAKQKRKRIVDERPDAASRLCLPFTRGKCPHGDDCKYNHDVVSFMNTKESDIGNVCYLYNRYGKCTYGYSCRWGDMHIDRSTNTLLERSVDDGGVIEPLELNKLHPSTRFKLQKNMYEGAIAPKKSKWKNQKKGKGDNRQLESEVVAADTKSIAPAAQPDTCDLYNGNIATNVECESKNDPSKSIPTELNGDMASTSSEADKATSREIMSCDKAFPSKSFKLFDFSNKVYIAPLTTVGNLPFRRVLKDLGADVTCSEMAMASNLLQGRASEWSLLRKHESEKEFGIQLAGSYLDAMQRAAYVVERETESSFVDLNCGCPIDVMTDKGCGASMMRKPERICDIMDALATGIPSRSVTVKMRIGWSEKAPNATDIVRRLQRHASHHGRLAAVMVHGRSRLQRYTKLANWSYIASVAKCQDPALPRIPVIGNGDIFSWTDWENHKHRTAVALEGDPEAISLCSCAMIGRGALIKPWISTEVKESRHWDIAAGQRLDIVKNFCNYGLEHWGSDTQGVNTTRRFLLEWLSFAYRYVPVGLIEYQRMPQTMNQRPPRYTGRGDLETLLASGNCKDWIRISEMFLGPVAANFEFQPKHRSNSYAPEASALIAQQQRDSADNINTNLTAEALPKVGE
jgi:tRNA-dihydrouridine synthase 3